MNQLSIGSLISVMFGDALGDVAGGLANFEQSLVGGVGDAVGIDSQPCFWFGGENFCDRLGHKSMVESLFTALG